MLLSAFAALHLIVALVCNNLLRLLLLLVMLRWGSLLLLQGLVIICLLMMWGLPVDRPRWPKPRKPLKRQWCRPGGWGRAQSLAQGKAEAKLGWLVELLDLHGLEI